MYIIVAGGGKVGYYLAKELVEEAHEVLVIEKDGKKCEQIAEELGDIVLRGDACEATTMEMAGFGRADMVIAVTGDDEDNLVVCQVAKVKFSVPRTVARINNPKNEEIFKRLGIDTTISATAAILSHIEQELPTHPLIPLLTLKGGGLEIVEVKVPANAAVVGNRMRDVLLPQQSIIALVIDQDGVPRSPTGDTVIRAGDEIVAVTRTENESALRAALTASTGLGPSGAVGAPGR
ncbi:MAG TPA: TrkA family potassium uptake protein [Dehalococcoidia bacterium]|nr:TrkA family potassium uptake protein [Dehalococcoidia bacterium]